MPRRSTILLNIAITLSLAFSGALSGVLIPSPVATGATSAPAAIPGEVRPDPASRRVKRQRRHDQKQQNRQQDRNRKADPKKPDPKKNDKKRDRPGAGNSREVSAEDRYIIVLKRGTGNPTRAADVVVSDAADVTVTHVYDHVFDGFAAEIPDDQLEEVRNDPRVQAVVPDEEVHAFEQTLSTGINRIDADRNTMAKIDGRDDRVDVDVAVLDSGIGPHPDLNVVGGVSCADGVTSYDDDRGHGTHVAGTIGALDNGIGVVGVAPGARLWAVKVLHSDGHGLTSEVICGLDWVAANSDKIDVVNMSLGKPGAESPCPGNDLLHNAVCRVVDAGVTVVAAAGNSTSDAATIRPATFDEVITVSALADSDGIPGGTGAATAKGPDDSLADFSNFGPDVDIAAPGVNILSTKLGGGYGLGWGTSMASPHVAGAAALFLANHPEANPAGVKAHLLSTREDSALPNDPDSINEGVLHVGDESAPPPPTVNPAPQDPPSVSPPPAKSKKGHKKGHKKGKKGGGNGKKKGGGNGN